MVQQEVRFLSIGGVATRLGVSPSAVRKWERQGRIPKSCRLEGNDRRIWPVAAVEQMAAEVAEQRAERAKEAVAA